MPDENDLLSVKKSVKINSSERMPIIESIPIYSLSVIIMHVICNYVLEMKVILLYSIAKYFISSKLDMHVKTLRFDL